MTAITGEIPGLLIELPLATAFILLLVGRKNKKIRNVIAAFSAAGSFCLALYLLLKTFVTGTVIYSTGASIPTQTLVGSTPIPIRIILEADPLSGMMALISSAVVFLAVIYSFGLTKINKSNKYPALLFLLLTGMTGIALTGDFFNMFVFLEIISVSSAGLIAFLKKKESIKASFKYMLVSAAAATMFLLGIALLYSVHGTLNMAFIGRHFSQNMLELISVALITSSLALKAGSVPMHFWVPDAYAEAPGPISAVLVVASQASLYALFRTSFSVFGFLTSLAWAIIILGILSMFVGVTMALVQKDLKKMMAFHAISQTGYMLLGVGVGLAVFSTTGDPYGLKAIEGGLFHVFNHALYKGLLFLTAGAVIHATGKRKLEDLKGLGNKMPFTTIFFLIGALAIAGIPPFNGFASKFMIYESVFQFNPVLSAIAILVSILTLASFTKVFYSVFLRPGDIKTKETPIYLIISMTLLAIAIILIGLFPGQFVDMIIEPAANALVSKPHYALSVLGGAIP